MSQSMTNYGRLNNDDADLIFEIVDRYVKMAEYRKFPRINRLKLTMDITVTHLHICTLDLKRFLEFPDFDFVHDIYGIYNHIDRDTFKMGCFLPRCAR